MQIKSERTVKIMAEIYALFRREDDALKAIDKIEHYDKDVKVALFSKDAPSVEEDVFFSDAKIIGSPSPMASLPPNSETESGSLLQLGFYPFCSADFLATCKNSLNESSDRNAALPSDGYAAGIRLKSSGARLRRLSDILKNSGAKII